MTLLAFSEDLVRRDVIQHCDALLGRTTVGSLCPETALPNASTQWP